MKKTIIWCVCLILLWAVIPLSSVLRYNNTKNKIETASVNNNICVQKELTQSDVCQIASQAIEHLEESSSVEAKKAILAICKNNYIFYKSSGLSPDVIDISKYSDALYNELLTLYEENHIKLSYKGDTKYIPMASLCGTNTSTCDEYPYITSVASPWDALSPDYNSHKEYPCGVSTYGINYLCEKGYSAKEALRWYLREFEIIDNST